MGKEKMFNDILRKAIEAIIESHHNGGGSGLGGEDGEVIIQLAENSMEEPMESGRLVDALRAAGYDVQTEVITLDNNKEEKKQQQSPPAKKPPNKGQLHPDEL
jgi:protein OS-9